MNRQQRRWAWTAMAALAVVGSTWASTPARAQDEPRQKQVEEIRKQIEELNRRLEELEKSKGAEPAKAAEGTPLPDGWLKNLSWRPIGPANMSGRIIAISVYEADPSTFWIATASGGLLKTTNNGITFEHQFDKQSTVSIGDVCVAPSDKDIVYVGTGENNPRNSVSYGDGVYKSTDGGKTWENVGLKGTFQVGSIVVHPKDPNIVYVGALGRLYGPNDDRGLYKTTDGGKTWEKVLFIDDKTGIIDIAMHPEDPETLIVASYQRKRDIYDTNDPEVKWGPGSGLHKTTDGGKTWTKLTRGLPTVQLGRIGIDYYRKDPKVVFAIVESEKIGSGPPEAARTSSVYLGVVGRDAEDKAQLQEVVEDGPAAKGGLKAGDFIQKADGKPIKTYEEFIDLLRDKKPGDKLAIEGTRAGEPLKVEVTLGERPAQGRRGGGDPNFPFRDSLGGQRENIQNRQGDDGFQSGGIYRSDDGGESWTRINSLNPRPMYFSQIRVDPSDDQFLYVLGISLYRSTDGGKTFKPDGGRGVHADQHALWVDPADGRHMILGCDGGMYVTYDRMNNWDHLNHVAIGQFYHVALDTRRFYNVYGGLQDNGTWGGPSRTKGFTGPVNEDWMSIGGGDGFKCQVDPNDPDLIYFTSQNGAIGRRHLKTGEVASFRPRPIERDKPLRFNWNTPFALSSHNSKIYYVAGNYVFKSLDRGNDLRPISREITLTDKGSATAFAESPKDPEVLYVGTDDGALWVTKDGGREWTRVDEKVGLPVPMYVATLEASRAEAGRVYACFDGHRSDNDQPHIYVSEDYGQTWTSLNGGLPTGSTRCLREDITNPNVLYLGTEFGAFVSVDRGKTWASLNTNLPTVAIHELAQHPTVGEMVAATHGRSLWIADVSALRQVTPDVLKEEAYLFQPLDTQRWHADPTKGRTNRRFVGENPTNGLPIYYHLAEKADKVGVKVFDVEGNAVRTLSASAQPGLQRVVWDLTRIQPRPARQRPASRERESGGESGEASESGGESDESGESGESEPERTPARTRRTEAPGPAFGRPQAAAPGTYRIVLTVDGKEFSRTVTIEPDPDAPAGDEAAGFGEEDEGEEEAERELREIQQPIVD